MKILIAILAAGLMACAARAADSFTEPVFQMRLVVDAPSSNSEQMTLISEKAAPQTFDVDKTVLLDQTDVKSAKAQVDALGQQQIAITFTDEGRKQFAKISGENLRKRLAIVVAGRLLCVPVVQTKITNGEALITGNFNKAEVKDLVKKITDAANNNRH